LGCRAAATPISLTALTIGAMIGWVAELAGPMLLLAALNPLVVSETFYQKVLTQSFFHLFSEYYNRNTMPRKGYQMGPEQKKFFQQKKKKQSKKQRRRA
jgi:hypothetical protein